MTRLTTIIAAIMLFAYSCTADSDLDSITEEDYSSVVEWIDNNLSTYYLYNAEYNEMTRNMSLSYSSFLTTHLLSMETNILDKKYDDVNEEYNLYSYVYRYASTTSTSMSRSLYATEVGYGFVYFALSGTETSVNALGVLGVYPDSPADNAGIKRGDLITAIGGVNIRSTNYSTLANIVLYPDEGKSTTVTINETAIPLTSEVIAPNPVLKSGYLDEDNKIGYIVYVQFNENFDTELKAALNSIKDAEHLILDLRLNGGGYNSSALLMGSAIAGNTASGSIFAKYTYNDTIAERYSKSDDYFSSKDAILDLPENKIYCLVSDYTASASELVINALRGVWGDEGVMLIGDTTEGKNVGMFIFNTTYDGYTYELAPITFISENAAGFWEYQDGFTPDYYVYEYYPFADFGVDDPLFEAAIDLINGVPVVGRSSSRSSESSTQYTTIVGRERYRAMIKEH